MYRFFQRLPIILLGAVFFAGCGTKGDSSIATCERATIIVGGTFQGSTITVTSNDEGEGEGSSTTTFNPELPPQDLNICNGSDGSVFVEDSSISLNVDRAEVAKAIWRRDGCGSITYFESGQTIFPSDVEECL